MKDALNFSIIEKDQRKRQLSLVVPFQEVFGNILLRTGQI